MPEFDALPRLAVLAGPAGIGKTRFCLENFARLLQESPRPFYRDVLYILPSAEHRERITDLVVRKIGSGFLGDRVTTLNRLMDQFLKETDHRFVTDAERRFLLADLIGKGGEYFSSVSSFPGFLETLGDFLGELKESLVSLETFRKGVEKLRQAKPEFAAKYGALLAIYEAYEDRLKQLGLGDRRDRLCLLKEREKRSRKRDPLFRHLFVDGFFDFSKSQLEFLRWLAARSERMTLALTIDLACGETGLFEIPQKTLRELEDLGFQPVDLSRWTNKRTSSETLSCLQRNLFRTPNKTVIASPPRLSADVAISGFEIVEPVPSPEIASSAFGGLAMTGEGSPPAPRDDEAKGVLLGALRPPPSLPACKDEILILEATGIRGEAEMIAREIRREVRAHRLPFSDLAVILRRIGEYEKVLRTVFREFGIPVEIHERERLREAPLARTVSDFFRILLEDWKREDLFNFLKSSYVERDYAEVCSLEIRSLDRGILGGRERWLSEMGGSLLEKIGEFHKRFETAETTFEFVRLTQEVIRAFGLDRAAPVYEEKSRRDFAALRRVGVLLEEILHRAAAQGLKERTFESFSRELLGLIEVDLFSLHNRDKNRVQVYDVSLARQKEYKVVFLAGLLEGSFPVQIREDPILSDEERRFVGLPERLPRQALERYFFYVGLTRAQEKVILSYPRFDLEGREALPSFYVDEVKKLFRDPIPLRSSPVSEPLPGLEEALEERELEAHLVKRLFDRGITKSRKARNFTIALYHRLRERESMRTLLPRVLFDPAARIENERIRQAFLPPGEVFKPTGLELYGKCPYRYFASEVLRLEGQEEGIDARHVGSLLHEVLEDYWRERIEKGKKELEALEAAKAFVTRRLQELLQKEPLTGERAYRIRLKTAQMEAWLVRMVEKEIEEGNPLAPLRPRYFELEFGFRSKEIDPLRLEDPMRTDLKLRGKIDRIDVDPSGRYAVVIDYKTGGSFHRKDLDLGRALQLPLYLLAVQKLLKLKPVGAEIYQINEARRSGFFLGEALEEGGIKGRRTGILAREEFHQMIERTVQFAFEFADGIRRAEIPVRPRDCDPHCPFPSLCRIEKWRLPFIYQEIREKDQARSRLSETCPRGQVPLDSR